MNQSLSKLASVLAIISGKIKNLKLRNKLILTYTITFTIVIGIAFIAIYLISEKSRQEEFYQRLKDKTLTTLTVLVQVEQIDNNLLKILDKNTINSMYEEKTLLFDSTGAIIYSSIDDTRIFYSSDILKRLKAGIEEIEMTEGKYELLGVRFENRSQTFYGITKAYDRLGHDKMQFLKYLLIATFIAVAGLLVLLSVYLSRLITAPITGLTKSIENISPDNLSVRIASTHSADEVGFLASKFNELLDRVENAFKFQYHFIHHLSHELKTPLAVMIANIEKAMIRKEEDAYERSLEFQRHALMELSHIINAMLDISKTEHQLLDVLSVPIRLDELLFECVDEINFLYDDVQFDFQMDTSIDSSDNLTVFGNGRMLKMAIMNLLKNAVNFSQEDLPVISLSASADNISLSVINDGLTISEEEQSQLFRHLFRGENSRNVKGFGLGLVLTQRIVAIHHGAVTYAITNEGKNQFLLVLPLALSVNL